MAVTFSASDSRQREHLLWALGKALDIPASISLVAKRCFEGEDASLYLWSFYFTGVDEGHRMGYHRGQDDMLTDKHAQIRVRANRQHNKTARRQRAKNRGK